MERFSREYKYFAKKSNHNECTLRSDRRKSLKLKIDKNVKMLILLQKYTVEGQSHFLTLQENREIIKKLERYVNERKYVTGYHMENYKFGNRYIANDAAIVADPGFDNSVVKIQSYSYLDMTENENLACSHLKTTINPNIDNFLVDYVESEKSNDSFNEYLKEAENMLQMKMSRNL